MKSDARHRCASFHHMFTTQRRAARARAMDLLGNIPRRALVYHDTRHISNGVADGEHASCPPGQQGGLFKSGRRGELSLL